MSLLQQLVDSLKCLPGVGEKSAQRMALHLLEKNRAGGQQLSTVLKESLDKIVHCQRCQNFTEHAVCQLCLNPKRNSSVLCIVETPADVFSIESMGGFQGLYFVLMGTLSPLDGIGPEDLGLAKLKSLCLQEEIDEVIFALGASLESEATIQYIQDFLPDHISTVSRIAYGVPVGGSLDYVDGGTLQHAFNNRKSMI